MQILRAAMYERNLQASLNYHLGTDHAQLVWGVYAGVYEDAAEMRARLAIALAEWVIHGGRFSDPRGETCPQSTTSSC